MSNSREVVRAGPSSVTAVTIHLCTAVPWAIAFTEWCLGAPPRPTFDVERGEDILPYTSPVTLLIPKHDRGILDNAEVRVAIHHGTGHPTQLLAVSGTEPWTGMVSVKSYGQLLRHEFGFESDVQSSTIRSAVLSRNVWSWSTSPISSRKASILLTT